MMVTEAGIDLEGLQIRGDPVRYRVEFDREEVSPSGAVVAGLATVADVDPLELPPLYESVDPDALDALPDWDSGRSRSISVTIDVDEYEVTVSNDGVVEIDPPETASLDGRPDPVSTE